MVNQLAVAFVNDSIVLEAPDIADMGVAQQLSNVEIVGFVLC